MRYPTAGCVAAFVAGCFIGGNLSYAASCPGGAEGASVTLALPYQTVLRDEHVRFEIKLTNNGKADLPYIPQSYDADSMQVFLKASREDNAWEKRPLIADAPVGQRGAWMLKIERDGDWGAVKRDATAVLRPGESCRWTGRHVQQEWFFLKRGHPKSVAAQVLVGPDLWATSRPVAIRILDKKTSDFPVVFKGVNYLRTMKFPVRVRRVAIEEGEYLFWDTFRVLRIAKESKIHIELLPHAGILVVSAASKKGESTAYATSEGELDSRALVSHCRNEFRAKLKYPELKRDLLEVLARHGGPASVKLFDEQSGGNDLLMKNRNNIECLRLLLSRAKAMADAEHAGRLVRQCLFATEYKPPKGTPIRLPEITSDNPSAKNFSKLLNGFVEDHGKISLSRDDIAKIKALAGTLGKASAVGKAKK